MAKLTAKKRKTLRKTQYAVPGKKKYPIPDVAHARNALARVAQFGTTSEKQQVRAAVKKKFPKVGQSTKRRRRK